ncbi:NADH dehydrogenase FAD-containing subunit [Lactobacillus sp. CBA3606]|uniref:NAD(P)/FAD-dependent oxidoreductase n=1 Tax=Lactobacillus sp. CBA3606 TaxID=2099789 RepID=UPI000CFC149F|nr:NAD(P)/FAD-dependent oxidoreductase [Lactobacillus sp. CBA3606]AVK62646.1 NADH dehydrogenase FAD-containing subunit [Lactobacillus sp. CBA3606]
MAKKNIVVVGAGFAGVYATKKLAKHFKKNADVEITLIDRHSYFTYMTELHEVATERVDPEHIQYDLQRLFSRRKNVRLVTDTVTGIDKEKQTVTTENGSYQYDQLLISLGGESNDFGTPGVKEHGFELWSFEQAMALRSHLAAVIRRGAVELDPAKRKAMLTLTVCGSGFTGSELVGELIEYRDVLARDNKLDPNEITLQLVEAAPTIINMLNRTQAGKAEKYMIKHGVTIKTNSMITGVFEDHVTLKDQADLPTYTLIWTAGVRANGVVDKFGIETGRGGRLAANEFMQAKGCKNIFLAGDSTFYQEPDQPRPVPQIVQGAEETAATAVQGIIKNVDHSDVTIKPFKGAYQASVDSIGSKYAVAQVLEKWNVSGFIAVLLKHAINWMYYVQIFSGYYLFQYFMHEFFRTRNQRNVFRGWTSRAGNVLWSVPLRFFYGAMWLWDCWTKVQGKESWFVDKLRLTSFSWLQVSATSGASESTSKAAKGIFSLSYMYGKDPLLVFDKMPAWFESVTKIFIPNMQMAFFFQKLMTCVEIAVALCIFFGLFTWLANGITIGLVIVFCLSGMFYWVNLWMIFAAIALMNGSGRTFGLDYWVVPWLQKHLGHWWYGNVRSHYDGVKTR